MTPETLSELKSLLEKATPGAWHHYHEARDSGYSISNEKTYEIADGLDVGDAELIVAIHNSAPDLIKAVEQRDRYRTALAKIRFHRGKDNFLRPILDKALKDTKEETE